MAQLRLGALGPSSLSFREPVVAEAGWPPPDDAGSSFDLLAAHGVIEPDLADPLRAAVGLRNRIAHGYASMDHARLHREASAGLASVRRFLAALVRGLQG